MTRNQNLRYIAACTLRDFLNANIAIINSLPNGASNLSLLIATLIAIMVEAETQVTSKTGYVDSSDSLRDKLIFEAADTARKMITFAKFTKNLILLAEIRMAKRKLNSGSKTDSVKNAQLIYDRAQSNLSALPTYIINTTTQATLSSAITAFTAVLGKTGTGRTERTQSTERLKVLFNTLAKTMTALSDSVEIVRTSKVDFYNGFKSAKKMPTSKTSNPMLNGIAVDVYGKAIAGIFIEMFLLDSEDNPIQDSSSIIKRTSGKKGGFKVQSTTDGNYLLIFKNLKFADEKVKVGLAKGQTVNLKVVMKSKL